jgi:hypothetical protein
MLKLELACFDRNWVCVWVKNSKKGRGYAIFYYFDSS